ncbi:hemoglobin/transferrin/lactoferrin receptor protein [Winogradskyella wandonensis]|uniref:Hemoglobin/transferrin/lactoferrin receptor protein n=1 Tax=Winogradskyella wandonensis TaxID=1442586 RepID=A0A4V2PTS2_9FLAO|nr:TonB-dependent receptor [Winogradskyella wandonensis]TCK67661.1 hemoglobin/transferrin/lactoferrin receptor protein [Winogradskyella wandonensis]
MLLTLVAHTQVISVFEASTEEPIPGVVLYNLKKDKSVITDINGKVSIDIFSANETIYFQNFLYNKLALKKSEIINRGNVVYLFFNIEGLNEVVVSASKFEQDKKDIPQRIVSVTARDIASVNPQTSADALAATGNIFVQKSQLGGGSPMIRGFSTNRLLIAVDGVRMNNAIFRGGNLQNVISIDPFSIQKAEVTLGSGSVVYGSDAIGGVMSFYTKKPQLSYKDELFLKTNAVLRYASANNENTAHADVNLGYKKWGFLTSISYTDFDDLRMGRHGPEDYLRNQFVQTENGVDVLVDNPDPLIQKPTGYNQLNLMQKVHYEPADNLKFDLGLHYSTTSEYGRYDRLIRPSSDGLRSAEWNYGPQKWFMSNLTVTKTSSNSSFYDKIQGTLAYQNFQESRIDRNFQSDVRRTRSETVDAFSFNLDLEKTLNPKSSLFYGIEYLFNYVGSSGVETDITTNQNSDALSRYPDGSTWQSMAAYTSYKYKPNDKFVFQSGIRYNHVIASADFTANNAFLNLPFNTSEINTGAFTGTAGIRWIPNDIIEWNFNASTAFRAPNIDDIGKVFDSEPGAVVIPNNKLDAEYAYGAELGLKLNFNNKLRLDLATYYTYLNDALIRRNSTLNGNSEILYDGELSTVQSIQNASEEYIYGFEVGAEINFSEDLKLRSQYNILGGVEEANGIEAPVRHIAPSFGRTHLIYNHKKFNFDAFAVYNNELAFEDLAPSEISKDYLYAIDRNGNPYSPSWYTLNFRVRYSLNSSFEINTSIENITDQRYRPYSSGISGAGRNLIISVKYSM